MEERGKPQKTDMVNSPPHYTGEVECIDAMVAAFGKEKVETYCQIAAFKYVWRAGKKGNDKEQDLAKANWYLSWATGTDPRNPS